MTIVQTLTPDQMEKVDIFFRTLAELRGEEYPGAEDWFLECMTGPYCLVQLHGGGDPVKAARNLV